MVEKVFTEEQEKRIPEFIDKWLKIGLSTEPVNREEAERIIAKIYKKHGHRVPKFRWYDNPLQAIEKEEIELSSFIFGSMEAYWLASYNFLKEVCDYKFPKKYTLLEEISQNCGWWAPFEGLCICTERPTAIRLNENKLLHAENRPAIEYAGGYELYSWNGVDIPAEFFQEGFLTPEKAITWENLEQRRAACELVGWHKILKDLDCEIVDEDGDPSVGKLVEVQLPDADEKSKFLIVECATERTFALEVLSEVKTALEANAWTWGLPADIYRPEVQT